MRSLVRQEATSQAQKLVQKVVRDCRWSSNLRSGDDRHTFKRLRAVLATALPCADRYSATGGVHRRSGGILVVLHDSVSGGIPNVSGTSSTANESIGSLRAE